MGSSSKDYYLSSFSNYGKSVGIIAPGEDITTAAWDKSDHDSGEGTVSGTSLAAPIVAGVMAQFVGYERIVSNTSLVYARLFANAVPGIIDGLDPETSNLFVNSGINHPDKDPDVPYFGAPSRRVANFA